MHVCCTLNIHCGGAGACPFASCTHERRTNPSYFPLGRAWSSKYLSPYSNCRNRAMIMVLQVYAIALLFCWGERKVNGQGKVSQFTGCGTRSELVLFYLSSQVSASPWEGQSIIITTVLSPLPASVRVPTTVTLFAASLT